MAAHLQRAIDKLVEQVIALSAKVEDHVKRAIQSLEEGNISLAEQVARDDKIIDQKEIDIEEECLKILALHQPVAKDLRYLVAVLKINNDLERIGDLAQNISRHSIRIIGNPLREKTFNLNIMEIYNKVQPMLTGSLDSLVRLDVNTAYKILESDDEVDQMHREFAQKIVDEIKTNPVKIETLIQYLHIARHLERIADHTTNIAEDIIYLIRGEIVRHGKKV
jgi:phosphate transport system protein